MPGPVVQWILVAVSFFAAGWAVGGVHGSADLFTGDAWLIGQAKRRLHAVRQWKTASEILALSLGGVVASLSTLGLGGWVGTVALVLVAFIGHGVVSNAEGKVHALERERERRDYDRPQ